MSHTAGPWHLSPTGRYVRYNSGRDEGLNLCDLHVFGGPAEEGAANASLICTAPDLLKSLQDLLNDTPYCHDETDCECGMFVDTGDCCHVRAHKAIAAAKGGGAK